MLITSANKETGFYKSIQHRYSTNGKWCCKFSVKGGDYRTPNIYRFVIVQEKTNKVPWDTEPYAVRIDLTHFIYTLLGIDGEIVCVTSTGRPRPYISVAMRLIGFDALHNLSHPVVRALIKLIWKYFVWRKMTTEVRTLVRNCLQCQRIKVTRHTRWSLENFAVPDKRFEHINIDLVGPLPVSNNYTYCLTCVDRFSRYYYITAETLAKTLLSGWISRFGVPKYITSNQGGQIESIFFTISQRCWVLNIYWQPHSPTGKWPNRTLAPLLESITKTPLGKLELDKGAAHDDVRSKNVAKMVYGQAIKLPGEFIIDEVNNHITENEFLTKL